MSNIDKLASELKALITESDNRKPRPYDTDAEVVRVDGDILWVHIPGGIEETPIKKTINAIAGDKIKVHVANGSAWISGNETAPPTDDRQAIYATNIAITAENKAENAINDAERAKIAADVAESNANSAIEFADSAKDSANAASDSANLANEKLSIIENVVGVLNIIAEHGTYIESTDDVIDRNKWYFVRTGEDEPYSYVVVTDLEGSPSEQGWYELEGIDEAVKNYVSSHLILNEEGLWLMQENTDSKLQITSEGVIIHGPLGPSAIYGSDIKIGNEKSFHIKITNNRLSFFDGINEIAYVSNKQLYISQTVVLQQMDLGQTISSGGLGLWSWKIHPNGGTPSRNNLNLKWIG